MQIVENYRGEPGEPTSGWRREESVRWPPHLPNDPSPVEDAKASFEEGMRLRAAQEARETRNAGRLLELVWAARILMRAFERTAEPIYRSALGELGHHIREDWGIQGKIPPEADERWAQRRVADLGACPAPWRRYRRTGQSFVRRLRGGE